MSLYIFIGCLSVDETVWNLKCQNHMLWALCLPFLSQWLLGILTNTHWPSAFGDTCLGTN